MLDCCYSGSYVRGLKSRGTRQSAIPVAQHFHGQGRAIITACSALQFAYESQIRSSERNEPSVFTASIVEGLRTGLADVDADGFVSVHDLYEYVRARVIEQAPAQTPEFSVDRLNGEFYIARNIQSLYLGTVSAPRISAALYNAIVQGEPWQRFGATLALERMLDSPSKEEKEAAREALIPLTRDPDSEISARALSIWKSKISRAAPIPTGQEALSPPSISRVTGRPMGPAIGIDFGTTNSTIAVLDGDDVSVIRNSFGASITPSAVGFSREGHVLVGDVAKRQAIVYPDRSALGVKRKLGSNWSLSVDGYDYSAERVAAYILERLRSDAEAYLDCAIGHALITVPAQYGVAEREALATAAKLAGLNVLRFINEPTAAAISYHLEKDEEAIILVFDLGGGTFDVSLLEVGEGVVEVKATGGDDHLGGEDWDEEIIRWLVSRFLALHDIDLSADKTAMQRLREAAENAKIELSASLETTIRLPYIAVSGNRPVHLNEKLTRVEFEHMTSNLLKRCKNPIEQVFKDAWMKIGDLTHVVLVGGSTRMPAVADLVRRMTGKDPVEGISPDETIAVGACIEAGVLMGHVKDVLLLDVTPVSLGIETKGGIFTKLIERNTTIPTRRSEIFSTMSDNQSRVRIPVWCGEREIAEYNKILGVLELAGIAPESRGIPQIEVIVDIDANGIVNVCAKDLGTRQEEAMTMSGETIRAALQRDQGSHETAELLSYDAELAVAFVELPKSPEVRDAPDRDGDPPLPCPP